jgi:hypothetical protein
MPGGVGNINAYDANPELVDWAHVSVNSPCRGAGSPLYATGTDIDGEPWVNPPSIGCDEVVEAGLVGPLNVGILMDRTNVLVNHLVGFGAEITGRIASYEWSYGDGTPTTLSDIHTWTDVGDYTVMLTAYNTDNPAGVSDSILIHVLPPTQPALQSAAMGTNGFRFEFAGQETARYWIEMATNIAPPVFWHTLQNILSSTGGVHQIVDSNATNATRFYRVRAR